MLIEWAENNRHLFSGGDSTALSTGHEGADE